MKTKEKVAQAVEAERRGEPEQSGGGLQGEYAGRQKLTSNSGGRIKIMLCCYRLWHERPGEKISVRKANREAQKQAGTESTGELDGALKRHPAQPEEWTPNQGREKLVRQRI
jgi:hypothetical protein